MVVVATVQFRLLMLFEDYQLSLEEQFHNLWLLRRVSQWLQGHRVRRVLEQRQCKLLQHHRGLLKRRAPRRRQLSMISPHAGSAAKELFLHHFLNQQLRSALVPSRRLCQARRRVQEMFAVLLRCRQGLDLQYTAVSHQEICQHPIRRRCNTPRVQSGPRRTSTASRRRFAWRRRTQASTGSGKHAARSSR